MAKKKDSKSKSKTKKTKERKKTPQDAILNDPAISKTRRNRPQGVVRKRK